MKSFEVVIRRSATHTVRATVQVDAESAKDAAEKALAAADGLSVEWSQSIDNQMKYGKAEVVSVDPVVDLDDSETPAL